jgi:hypothetical protein
MGDNIFHMQEAKKYLSTTAHFSLLTPLHCDLSFRGDVQVLGVVMMREREQQKLSPWITIAVLVLR